jgi:predicted ATPase
MDEPLVEVGVRLSKPHYVVGRESEIRYLEQYSATVLQGQRQMVFVTGEPGIGKTTLVESFLTKLQTRSGLYIGRGQCVEQ